MAYQAHNTEYLVYYFPNKEEETAAFQEEMLKTKADFCEIMVECLKESGVKLDTDNHWEPSEFGIEYNTNKRNFRYIRIDPNVDKLMFEIYINAKGNVFMFSLNSLVQTTKVDNLESNSAVFNDVFNSLKQSEKVDYLITKYIVEDSFKRAFEKLKLLKDKSLKKAMIKPSKVFITGNMVKNTRR